jgi:hypothetical protein
MTRRGATATAQAIQIQRPRRWQAIQSQAHNHTRLAVRAAALLCLLVITACEATPSMKTPDASAPNPMQSLTETFSLQQVIEFIGQPFPASATGVEVTGKAALDTMVLARFDAPREDIPAYLAGLGLTIPLMTGYSPFFSVDPPYREAASWWSPPTAADTSGSFDGLYQQVGSKHYKVVVVGSDPNLATVYLQVYNT